MVKKKYNVQVFNRGLLGNGAVLGLPNLAAGSLAPQASDDKADGYHGAVGATVFCNFSQIPSCEISIIMASSNIFSRKDARYGRTQPQLVKAATVAGYRPKLLQGVI